MSRPLWRRCLDLNAETRPDDVTVAEIAIRMTAFIAIVGIIMVACVPPLPPQPVYFATPDAVAAVQTPVVNRQSLAVYGDSRGSFFAEGARMVEGWYPVTKLAREGCAFTTFPAWMSWGNRHEAMFQEVNVQRSGETVSCASSTYLAETPPTDLAIVYAGTLLTVNLGSTADTKPPTDPAWAKVLEDDLAASLSMIQATRIVILPATPSLDAVGNTTYGDELYWSNPERSAAVNAILDRVAVRTGATFLPGFADWLALQPKECQPDGSHMTVDCAQRAGEWIKARL